MSDAISPAVAHDSLSISATQLKGVVVVIPARNEEDSLPLVLRDLPAVDAVIVVDNGSADRTAAIAAALGAIVVRENRPGYGSACLAGLEEISRRTKQGVLESPQAVAFLDGDYSDHPNLLPQLVEPVLAGTADFVLGSRLMGQRERGAMPPQSVFGNRLACLLMRLFWGASYTDLGPFRAIRYDLLRELQMHDRDFGWTVEMQIKAVTRGLRIREISVPYRRRIGVSKISGTITGSARAGFKILYTIGKYMWRRRDDNRLATVH